MARIDSTSISISGNIYSAELINFKNGAGQGEDVGFDYLHAVPLIVSGLIRVKDNPRIKFGYAILGKTNTKFASTERKSYFRNLIPDNESPGSEEFIGQYTLNNTLAESAFVVGGGYALSDRLSAGLSMISVYRHVIYTTNFAARVVTNPGTAPEIISNNQMFYVSYGAVRAYPKVSALWKEKKWSVSLAFTAPSFAVGGKAKAAADLNPNNIDALGLGRSSYLANDRQEGLSVNYKSPWSLSAGFLYSFRTSTLFANIEYFGSINAYNVVTPNPSFFVRPVSAGLERQVVEFLTVKDQNRGVVNIALGFEQKISGRLLLLGGVRTNRSYSTGPFRDASLRPVNVDWDLYHSSLGAVVKRKNQDVSIGVQFGWGANNAASQFVNLDTPTEQNLLLGTPERINATYQGIGLILGYTHRL